MSIPKILYKYRDWSNGYHKRVLTHNEIYFASPNEFNDPFDCSIPFKYDEKDLTDENIFIKCTELARQKHPELSESEIHSLAFEHQKRDVLFDEHYLEEYSKIRIEDFNNTFTVLSLTQKKENFLMWSHYSYSHSGFCIGYNSQKLINQSGGQLSPIIYCDQFPTFGFFDDAIKHIMKYAYHKSKIWEYEAEYRILREAEKGKILKLNNDTVEEVVLGYKMEQKEKFTILEIIKNKFPNARVYDSKTHKTKFQIDLNRIR